jgi:alkylation response protein AidB-like acyl-CoA dehydrogenase
MFQVIENARMMVGTKAIATLSTGYLNALEYAKTRVQGADLTQAATRPRRGSRSPTTPTYAAR